MNRSRFAVAILLLVFPRILAAQGFGIYEQGTCAMGRAGASVARPCRDGSAMFYNPAGLVGDTGLTASAGVTLIAAGGSFTDDYTGTSTGLSNGVIPIPHAYVQYGVNRQFAVGAGLFFPYGLTTKWPITFDGRFNGYDNTLRTMYIQPTAAYHAGQLSVGAGLDIAVGSVELHQQLDLFEQPAPAPAPPGTTLGNLGIPFHTPFADAALKATGATGVGGHVGITFEPNDMFAIGARYLSRIKLNYTGTATFTKAPTGITLAAGNPFGVPGGTPLDVVVASSFLAGGPLADGNVSTTITMPDQIVAGVAAKITPDARLFVDYIWEHWQLLNALVLTFSNPATPTKTLVQNDRNTSGVRVGGEWSRNDRVTVRGGWLYHSAAAPAETVTPLLPEGSRNEFTGGLGLTLTKELRADVAYQFIKQQDRRGRVREGLPGTAPTVSLNSGLYTFHAHLVALTLTVRF